MNVLYICQYMANPRTATGSSRHYEIARRLVEAGHRVHMVTTDKNLDEQDVAELEDGLGPAFSLAAAPTAYDQRMSFPRRIAEFAVTAMRMTGQALQVPADVTFVSSTPLTVLLPALVRKFVRGTPFVFEVRDLWPEVPFAVGALSPESANGRLALALARLGYHQAEAILALSPDMRDGVVAHGIDPVKVTVTSNAGNPDVRVEAASDDLAAWFRDAEHRYLYGGSLGLVNDVPWLVDVFERVVADHGLDARLLIVGGGGAEVELDRAIAQLDGSVRDRVRRLGKIPKARLLALQRHATLAFNLFADIPELDACSPNKVFDAWADGVAVASNQGGWLARVLEEDGSGLALSRDRDQAAAELADVTVGDTVRMGTDARQASRERYSWDVVGNQVHDALVGAQAR